MYAKAKLMRIFRRPILYVLMSTNTNAITTTYQFEVLGGFYTILLRVPIVTGGTFHYRDKFDEIYNFIFIPTWYGNQFNFKNKAAFYG